MVRISWFEQTITDAPPGDDWMSDAERARLRQLRFAKRRQEWRLGRWTAKLAVAAVQRLPPDALPAIEVRPLPSGAPQVFLSGVPLEIAVSLSHRDQRAVCCLADAGTLLGCDLEAVEPHSDGFIADFFCESEQALLAEVAGAERSWLATLLWSAKESVLKAIAAGLAIDTRAVAVRLSEPVAGSADVQWNSWTAVCVDGRRFSGWWQREAELLRTAASSPNAPFPPSFTRVLNARAISARTV